MMTPKQAATTVLLLEDQALIALYVEELLHQAGFDHINTMSSCSAAEKWLESNSPGLAVIETKLRDGKCEAIALLLEQRKIPYVVHSADGHGAISRSEIARSCKWLSKPCDADDFIAAVQSCVPEMQH